MAASRTGSEKKTETSDWCFISPRRVSLIRVTQAARITGSVENSPDAKTAFTANGTGVCSCRG